LFVHTDGCLDDSCGICQKPVCPMRQKPFKLKVDWTVKNISDNQKHKSD
jgi:hypothetical protein